MADSADAVSSATEAPAEGVPGAVPGSAISEEEVSALLEKHAPSAVRPYDFTAQRINQTQMPMLEVICKSFAERGCHSLTALLGRDAALHFSGVDSAKAGDTQAGLPAPVSIAVMRLKPLVGNAFVCVEPALLLTLLDGFFGGTGRATTDMQAAIAPAAQRFLGLMLRSLAGDWAAAWQPVAAQELELVKQETNPRLLQLGSSQDALVVLRFNIEFGARGGKVEWFIPETMLGPVRELLSNGGGGATAPLKKEAWAPSLGAGLQGAEVETRAILAEASISLRELVRLSPGDIIPIEAPQHVTLLAGDVPLFRGRFGVSEGHNAMKIIPGAG